jgi:pSer/pThr/pTyr-binding forkhead associated (FHA) protein
VGIKDVFDRIKGKSANRDSDDAEVDDLKHRQTGEETILAPIGGGSPQPRSSSQESATMIAPASDRPTPQARPTPDAPQAPAQSVKSSETSSEGPHVDATVVTGASPPPSIRNAGPPPHAPGNPPPSVRPSVTPVAPSPNRAAPQTPIAPVSDPPAAKPGPSSPASSDDATFYQSPDTDNALELAAVLVGIYGEAKNELFRVPFGTTTIGRGDGCGVQLLDAKVSREHATLLCEGDTIALTPRSERNPILVNEEPITSSHALADGDKVQFGNPGASILRIRTIPGL